MCGPLGRGRACGGAGGTIRDVVRIIRFGGVVGFPWRGPQAPSGGGRRGKGEQWWGAVGAVPCPGRGGRRWWWSALFLLLLLVVARGIGLSVVARVPRCPLLR